MKPLSAATAMIVMAAFCAPGAQGQTAETNAVTTTSSATSTLPSEGKPRWAFGLSAYTYLVPDSREYVQPTFTADGDWLHLEARFNYEDLNTGSAWVGYNFAGGNKFNWEFTPMLGGVFGNTTGIAPGYKGSLSWWKLELFSEGECVFDAGSLSDSFFYTWSELSLAPVDWFRFGLVTQRTRLYRANREIQRGFLVGSSFKHVDLTLYVFNPDEEPIFVIAAALRF